MPSFNLLPCLEIEGVGLKLGNEPIHVTPHQFRHLAGELILRENPGAYGLVQQVLGHINLKTTMNFYAADHSRDAGRVLDGIVTARRQRTKV